MGKSAPCYDCYKKMMLIGVKTIVYSDGDGISNIKKIKLRDYVPSIISAGRRFINCGYNKKKCRKNEKKMIMKLIEDI